MPRFPPARPRNPGARRAAVGYALLAVLVTALALVFRDGVPWTHPAPWLTLGDATAPLLSAVIGVAFALVLCLGTRLAVSRYAWAQHLHRELRPVARDLTLVEILVLAGLSSLGEELLFRGLLVPWFGVLPAAVLFGLAHQLRGPSRWVWVGWATGVGLGLGALFAATGSLLGPFLAHALVNAVNLSFLRDHEPDGAGHDGAQVA